ncbi:MAG: aromatic ring-hydroxylating dioxygenase subunit alpha [Spongiibacteraceae bacterium]
MNVQVTGYQAPDEQVAWMGTDPIPAKPYYDADYFELERKAIFMRSWLNIGHVSEVPEPGCFIKRELEFAKASLLIVRGKDGVLRAFHNACTHRATQLVEEASGKASAFLCPYHMWNFGTDGQLRAAPDFDRFAVKKEDCALKQVAIDVCAGLIFVNLEPSPQQSLRDYLGDMAEKLESMPVAKATTFSEYVYEIEGNWKITYDNFQENYHLRYIHSSTGVATISPDNPHGYPVNYGFYGPHRTQTIWTNPQPIIKPMQGFAFGKGARAAMAQGLIGGPNDRTYCAVFPSLFVIGTPTQHFSHMVYPLSATRSRGVIRVYWVGDDHNASERFAREYTLGSIRDIHSEDVNVIERGQRGLNSGALEHIHFQAMEGLCRHLFQTVDTKVQAYRNEINNATRTVEVK